MLYEREYGVHNRAEERATEARAAHLASKYQRSAARLPRDPNYVEAKTTPE